MTEVEQTVEKIQETSGEERENFNPKKARSNLFRTLEHVLDVSREKFDKEKASNADRQSWGRLIVNAVQAYGKLVESAELEELADRLEKLEWEVNRRNDLNRAD